MIYQDLFYPAGVAVFGSVKPGKLAAVIINRLKEGNMPNVYAVNPKAQGMENVPGCDSVLKLKGQVQLAVIAAPAAIVKDILEECGQAGIKAAAIITSGFSEAGNVQGEQELLEIASRYGMRFVGPNCAGVVNTHSNLLATLETRPPKGNIAIISQSGAVGGILMSMAKAQKIGISKFVSFGNGLDLNMMEFLEWMKTDDETKVVAIYMEAVKNGRAFMKVLSELTEIKPVVIVKAGHSSAGQRAALSHTGSMAGVDAVFDAALGQCGAVRAESLEDLFDICRGFSALPEIKGERVLIVTNSGGPGVMTTDKSEEVRLSLPEPSQNMKETLGKFLPSFASIKNPVDLTVEGTGEQYRDALANALEEYDAAVALYIGTPYLKSAPIAEGIIQAGKSTGKPIAVSLSVGTDMNESLDRLEQEGIPAFISGERAVKVFAKMAQYYKCKKLGKTFEASSIPTVGTVLPNNLLEPDVKELLQKNNISVPPYSFVHTAEEAAQSGEELGWPVVMKVVSPQIIHKSDVGGVLLGIDSPNKAREAFKTLEKIAEGRDFRGAIMYHMLDLGREVIIGLTNDASFGPVVVFGLGGIYTEVLKDVVFKVAPVDEKTALTMIKSIKSYKLLEGIRGGKSIDMQFLAKTISELSYFPFKYTNIREMDLNPVFAYEDGVIAVDARIVTDNEA
ncbi:acetate--CoA ligase family protein [Pectinatus haikarae]|uniref:acetate--CoA ligase family protein n=1 Tax=Pectinatus haikarae TaxID=349096 RepID=UPI0018C4BAB1|nr:acetate--CoA ligase family protein [Pectinatus haikarae]